MSRLIHYSTDAHPLSSPIQTGEDISAHLEQHGVLFEQWNVQASLSPTATQDEILDAYADDVRRLQQRYGFGSADVISVHPEHPQRAAIREKFLQEHTHTDFEVRFFVDGRGLFFLHIDESVFAIMCERGDLISVPADVPHWFDMGATPELTCIRLFTDEAGWVAQFTGDTISTRFPDLDTFRKQPL